MSRVAAKARARGWESSEGELGKAMGEVMIASSSGSHSWGLARAARGGQSGFFNLILFTIRLLVPNFYSI